MTITEVWAPIKGYEGIYEVSNLGRVKHIKNGLKKLRANKYGYITVGLWCGRKKKYVKVHRLVAEVFIPNPHNKPEVNHIDYDKTNNHVSNLQWMTSKENNIYSLPNRPKEYQLYANSTTKEKNISYTTKRQFYRVEIKKKYYGVYKTLEEAIKARDKILADYEKYSTTN